MTHHANTRRFRVPLVCLAIAGAARLSPAGDWPMYRGASHDGVSQETGWLDAAAGVKVLWSVPVTTGCSSIAVAGGRVYTMGNKADKDTVFCFDAATGRKVWTFTYDCPLDKGLYEGGPNSTPTVEAGRVYTLSRRGHLFCLDAAKGTRLWNARLAVKPPGWGLAGSPLVLGKMLILNAGSAGTAVEKDTGKVTWQSGAGPGGYSTPVPYPRGGQTLLTFFSKASVLAVRPDGAKVWEHPWKTSYDVNAGDPIPLDGGKKVFISSGYNKGCALLDVSGATPREVWRNRNMRNHRSCSVLYKGAIYGFDESTLTCLDPATGEKKWTQGGLGKGSLIVADGKLVILAEDGRIVVAGASPDGFKALASGRVVRGKCWAAPALANGRIYARSKLGTLACATLSGK